jgi:spore coat polysaccharide biosynthesis protein SpsF
MKIVAIIPVRMASKRLPGKPLRLINSKPILGHLIDRLRTCDSLDEIIVATSRNKENDKIYNYCQNSNIKCFRGAEDDVLERLTLALKKTSADIGVLIFGDGPLVDPAIIREFVEIFLTDKTLDFLSNDIKTTYPPGMEVEVFKTSALEDSHRKNNNLDTRKHGTLYIRQNPEQYKCKNIEAPKKYCRPELELELDTVEDLEVVKAIFKEFTDKPNFNLDDIIKFLDKNPKISEINLNVPREWQQYRLK